MIHLLCYIPEIWVSEKLHTPPKAARSLDFRVCVLNHPLNPGDRPWALASWPVGDFSCLWTALGHNHHCLCSPWFTRSIARCLLVKSPCCLFFQTSADGASMWEGLLTWPSVLPGLSTEPWEAHSWRGGKRRKTTNTPHAHKGILRDSGARHFSREHRHQGCPGPNCSCGGPSGTACNSLRTEAGDHISFHCFSLLQATTYPQIYVSPRS